MPVEYSRTHSFGNTDLPRTHATNNSAEPRQSERKISVATAISTVVFRRGATPGENPTSRELSCQLRRREINRGTAWSLSSLNYITSRFDTPSTPLRKFRIDFFFPLSRSSWAWFRAQVLSIGFSIATRPRSTRSRLAFPISRVSLYNNARIAAMSDRLQYAIDVNLVPNFKKSKFFFIFWNYFVCTRLYIPYLYTLKNY